MSITAPDVAIFNLQEGALETPFAEVTATPQAATSGPSSTELPWTETYTPFTQAGPSPDASESEAAALADEVFESLHDEAFTEALDTLVDEVTGIVDQRLVGEQEGSPTGALDAQRRTLAEAHLAPVAVAAERYLDRLISDTEGLEAGQLSEERLEQLLAPTDAVAGDLSPAGEEFLGALARKVGGVVSAVKKVGALVSPLLTPVLRRLRALVQPLLNRVLAVAIDRLPADFRGPARMLAQRLGIARSEAEHADESPAPTVQVTTEDLGEAFDATLTEFLLAGQGEAEAQETFSSQDAGEDPPPADVQAWHTARRRFVDTVAQARPGQDLTPAVEQFLPALLPVLRIALRLAGRPRVVSAIAGYLATAIKGWVGPALAAPLARALVDTGLRMATLESSEPGSATPGAREQNFAAQVVASTVEDTVRGLAGLDEAALEDEDLLGAALSESFERAVAANFPPELVKPELQLAPTLGGSFVVRAAHTPHPFKKFSRVPELEVTVQVAESIRTFGGHSLAASLRARGIGLPMRARVHIYEAMPGTSLPRLAVHERFPGADQPQLHAHRLLHPLTPEAAGVLLREPALAVSEPEQYLQSRRRIAIGQRFYYLEPMGPAGAAPVPAATGRAAVPSRAWVRASSQTARIDLRRSRVVIRLFFSEADAQTIVAAMTRTRSSRPLLRALLHAYDQAVERLQQQGPGVAVRTTREDETRLGPGHRRVAPAHIGAVRRLLDRWARPVIARWVRSHAAQFASAVQHPQAGVTVTITLHAVPGVPELGRAMHGRLPADAWRRLRAGMPGGAAPTGAVHVTPGRHL